MIKNTNTNFKYAFGNNLDVISNDEKMIDNEDASDLFMQVVKSI